MSIQGILSVDDVVRPTISLAELLPNLQLSPDTTHALEQKFSRVLDVMIEKKIEELKDENTANDISDNVASIQNEVQSDLVDVIEKHEDSIASNALEIDSLSQQEFNDFIVALSNKENLTVDERWNIELDQLRIQCSNVENTLQEIVKQVENIKSENAASFFADQNRSLQALQENIEQAQSGAISQTVDNDLSIITSYVEQIKAAEKDLSRIVNDVNMTPDERSLAFSNKNDEISKFTFDCQLAMALAQKQMQEQISDAYAAIVKDFLKQINDKRLPSDLQAFEEVKDTSWLEASIDIERTREALQASQTAESLADALQQALEAINRRRSKS